MANRAAVELAVALGVGAISVAGVLEASGYRAGSSTMPLAVTAFAAALSAVWAVQAGTALARGTWGRLEVTGGAVRRFALVVAATVLYVLAVTHVGFFTSTLVMVPLFAFAIGYRNLKVALAATAGFCVVLYGVFRLLLKIPLPQEVLLRGLGL